MTTSAVVGGAVVGGAVVGTTALGRRVLGAGGQERRVEHLANLAHEDEGHVAEHGLRQLAQVLFILGGQDDCAHAAAVRRDHLLLDPTDG